MDATPITWDNCLERPSSECEWELTGGLAGAKQWRPKDGAGADAVPDADPSVRHAPMMATTDLSMRLDPAYEQISRRFMESPDQARGGVRQGVVQAVAPRHGTVCRYLGPWVPEPQA